MIITTRRIGESLIISDDITVTVLGIKENTARLGINSPTDLSVHREEIYQRIILEQAAESYRTKSGERDSAEPEHIAEHIETLKEVAKRMLQKKISIQTVIEITDLPLRTVQKLKEEEASVY